MTSKKKNSKPWKHSLLAGYLLIHLFACGNQADLSRAKVAHKNSSDAESKTQLSGQPLPNSLVLDMLSKEIENSPPTVLSKTAQLGIVAESVSLEQEGDIHNFLLCEESGTLEAIDVEAEFLAEAIDHAQAVIDSYELDQPVDIDQTDTGSGMTLFLANEGSLLECIPPNETLVTWDPYNLLQRDRGIVNLRNYKSSESLGDHIAMAYSLMIGASSERDLSPDAPDHGFDSMKPYSDIAGETQLEAMNLALSSYDPKQTVNIEHLDQEIGSLIPNGISSLSGIDRVLTIISIAGSSSDQEGENPGKIDPKKAAEILKDGFINSSGTLAKIATLAGHPEIAVGISIAATLLGGRKAPNNPEEASPSEQLPQEAYLPDLAAFLEMDADSHEELLADYRNTYRHLEQKYPENFYALRSLLKLATAQYATTLAEK